MLVYANRFNNFDKVDVFIDDPTGKITLSPLVPGLKSVNIFDYTEDTAGEYNDGIVGNIGFPFKTQFCAHWNFWAKQDSGASDKKIAVRFGITRQTGSISVAGAMSGTFGLDTKSEQGLQIYGLDSGNELGRQTISFSTWYQAVVEGTDYDNGLGNLSPGSLNYWVKGGSEFPEWTLLGTKQHNLNWADTTAYETIQIRTVKEPNDPNLVKLANFFVTDHSQGIINL